jgi:hypothetical protein
VKKVNAKRSKKEFAACFHSKERVAWIRNLPCIGCGREGISENAHSIGGGGSRRAGYETIGPLCGGLDGCHRKYDTWLAPFDTQESHEIIQRAAMTIQSAWLEYQERAAA